VILLAIKVNFSNLFFAVLLVTSCIEVGNNEEFSNLRRFLNHKKQHKTSESKVLIEKCFVLIERNQNNWKTEDGERRRSCIKKKVGPFLILKNFLFLWILHTSLQDTRGQNAFNYNYTQTISFLPLASIYFIKCLMYLKINTYKTDKNTICNSLGSRTNKQNCWKRMRDVKKGERIKVNFIKRTIGIRIQEARMSWNY
jgi:hypothetical protein